LEEVVAARAHVLWQAGPDEDLPRLATLPDGSYLSRLAVRSGNGGGPRGLAVRVIPDTGDDPPAGVGNPGRLRLMTDVLDARLLPAEAGIAAHAARWRLEDCFSVLDRLPTEGSAVMLRSKEPGLIRQEVHAILCCYQAVRLLVAGRVNGGGVPELVSRPPEEPPSPPRALPAFGPGPPVGWPGV
ncbi:MAG: hypothetical protein ACRDNL_12850, partial [Spirillospora sp.]